MKIRPFNVSDPKPQVEPALDQSQIVQAALGLLDDFVIMCVLEETQYANAEVEGASEDSSSGVHNWIESLPPNEYLSVVALANYLADPDGDERFRFGVELLRNGLETLLARRKA